MGETPLHMAMLFSEDEIFLDIAKTLLKVFPRLALDIYEGDEYFGKFCLQCGCGPLLKVLLEFKPINRMFLEDLILTACILPGY